MPCVALPCVQLACAVAADPTSSFRFLARYAAGSCNASCVSLAPPGGASQPTLAGLSRKGRRWNLPRGWALSQPPSPQRRRSILAGPIAWLAAFEFEASSLLLTSRRCEEVGVHGTPTGESNPAATSTSWWQGPPLGHSQIVRCHVDTATRLTSAIVMLMAGRPCSERCSRAALAGPSNH